ncbi:MAG: hypothetical protein MUC97_15280 [Bernardetiaceae bacterium]|jgi:hypothetical protein|nr:hypothetical protein [Bernardetiaceae bacterium]
MAYFHSPLSSEEKKAFLLLKVIIFHYHGLDEDEQLVLEETAREINALAELRWANDFIEDDYYNAFDRARDYLRQVMNELPKETRFRFMANVWEANQKKGYISEMEATAILRLAKDWQVEEELLAIAKKH